MRKQAEMSIEQLENGQYVEYIAYPYVECQHMTFENGMQIEKALEDDVAMPTVTHDTSSFKAGQGDSDVSDSIVDGSIASMTIKGQTIDGVSTFDGVDKVEIVSQNADNTLSNTTSFPITNPLRSLPNGVRDEIVLDRMSNKAKLIQRVGEDLTQLASPIVTQVDIEGFPYVYKNGHIFLNTEVAPTTEVKYSINQSQIIESQSEDIARHSKEINNLYNLIATYVQVNYDSTLLNLKTKGV